MRKALKIILAVVLVAAVISTVHHCANPYSTQTVTYYEFQKSIRGEGYILRDETVVSSDVPGVFEPFVNEGERVSRDARVGTVMTGEPDSALISELNEVRRRIEDIEQSATIAGIYQSDTVRIANAVTKDVTDLREAVREGDLAAATELKREIGYLKNRTSNLESSEQTDLLLEELYLRRDEIEKAVAGVQKAVYAPISGVYSSAVDGLEGFGSAEKIASLTPDDVESFDEIIDTYKQDPSDVCKISDNFAWYLTAVISEEEAADVELNGSVTVNIDTFSTGEVNGTVYSLSEAQDGKRVMVIRSDLFVEGISGMRRVDYQVTLERRTGLRIPSSALRIENGQKGVYILLDKQKSFKAVNNNPYRSEDDEYYIVERKYSPPGAPTDYVPLKEYDKVLINPEEVR